MMMMVDSVAAIRRQSRPANTPPQTVRHSQQVPAEELLKLTNLRIDDDDNNNNCDHHQEAPRRDEFGARREQPPSIASLASFATLASLATSCQRAPEASKPGPSRMQHQQQAFEQQQQQADQGQLMLMANADHHQHFGQPLASSATGAALAQPIGDHYNHYSSPMLGQLSGSPGFQFAGAGYAGAQLVSGYAQLEPEQGYAGYQEPFCADYQQPVGSERARETYQAAAGELCAPEPPLELLELSSRPKDNYHNFRPGEQQQQQLPASVIRVNSFGSVHGEDSAGGGGQLAGYYSQQSSADDSGRLSQAGGLASSESGSCSAEAAHRKCAGSFAGQGYVVGAAGGEAASCLPSYLSQSHNYSPNSSYQLSVSQTEIDIGQTTTICGSGSAVSLVANFPASSGASSNSIRAGTGSHSLPAEPDLRLCEWEDCERTFMDMELFVKHLEDEHVNQTPRVKNRYFCLWSNCKRNQQEFNARYKLLIHMRVHSGEKPYPCTSENCKKSFSRLENLKIHVRSHTGEKPYKCNFPNCNKSFTNSSDRIKHHKTHRDPKPYACPNAGCSKRYTDPSSLRKHLRAHKRQASHSSSVASNSFSNNNNNHNSSSSQLAGSYSSSGDCRQPPAYQQTLPLPVEQVYAAGAGAQVQADFDPATLILEGADYVEEQYQPEAADSFESASWQAENHQQLVVRQQHEQFSRSWCAGAACCRPANNNQNSQIPDQQRTWQPTQQNQEGGWQEPSWNSREQQHNAFMRSLPVTGSSQAAPGGFRAPTQPRQQAQQFQQQQHQQQQQRSYEL